MEEDDGVLVYARDWCKDNRLWETILDCRHLDSRQTASSSCRLLLIESYAWHVRKIGHLKVDKQYDQEYELKRKFDLEHFSGLKSCGPCA